MLHSTDVADVGLAAHFLGDDTFRLSVCIVALSGDARHLALARGHQVLLLPQPQPLAVHDEVRSMCWLVPTGHGRDVLMIGCVSGKLMAFSALGALLWTHTLNATPLVQLQPAHTDDDDCPELVCLHETHVVACYAGALGRALAGRRAAFDNHKLPAEAVGCHSLVCCGLLPRFPLDLSPDPEPHERRLALVGATAQAVQLITIAPPLKTRATTNGFHATAAAAAPSAGGGGGRVARVARGLGAAWAYFGGGDGGAVEDGIGSGGGDGGGDGAGGRGGDDDGDGGGGGGGGGGDDEDVVESSADGRASPSITTFGEAEVCRDVGDAPRVYERLVLEPRRRWIAATDTLGRVTLLEPRSLVAVRLWKGYREALCGWTDTAAVVAGGNEGGSGTSSRSMRAKVPLLVIYAPRRGLLELWRVPSGGRVCACTVGPDCVLLTPPPRPAPIEGAAEGGGGRARCWLLQPSGVLSLIAAGGVDSLEAEPPPEQDPRFVAVD